MRLTVSFLSAESTSQSLPKGIYKLEEGKSFLIASPICCALKIKVFRIYLSMMELL